MIENNHPALLGFFTFVSVQWTWFWAEHIIESNECDGF